MALFTSSSPELLAMTDPTALQIKVLEDFSDRLGANENGHRQAIVDPHSVFNFLVESNAIISSELALAAHQVLSRQHAHRSHTSEDLYMHMSDFDYVNMFATPAEFTFKLMLDKNYLFNNAPVFNTNYRKVVIPKNTVFTIGKYTFGIHYPIEIRLNNSTRDVSVMYDTSVVNPLQNLKTNILESFEHASYKDQNLLTIYIPTFQFARKMVKEPLVSGHGFTKSYTYNNKFYALRALTNTGPDDSLVEMSQTIANSTYDPYTPTVRIYLEEENHKVKINIPQVYFTKGLVGSYVLLEFFTTHGAVDVDISNAIEMTQGVNFNLKEIGPTDVAYSQSLARNPIILISSDDTKLTGGSDNLSFTDCRNRVIHNAFHTGVAITRLDLDNRFKDNGYNVVMNLDNLTRRIYFAYKLLTDGSSSIVHTKQSRVVINTETASKCRTVLNNTDGTITILPSSIYRYDADTDTCTVLDNTELNYISALMRGTDKEQLCAELNNHTYMKSPFHMRLVHRENYPRVTSYNMMNPTVNKFIFEKENINIATQMTTAGGVITHNGGGVGGYTIQILVKKTKDLATVPESDIIIYAYTESNEGTPVGTRLTHKGEYQQQSVYTFDVLTDYWIDANNGLSVTNLTYEAESFAHAINMESKFHVLFMVAPGQFPGTATETSMYEGLPSSMRNNICLTRQTFVAKFADILSDTIYNDIIPVWSEQVYKKHQVDVPLKYTNDIYATDADGVTVFKVENDKVVMTKLHSKGEVCLDEENKPIILHHTGDYIIENGSPVIEKERVLNYYISSMMIDAKVYASEHADQIAYIQGITSTLMSYLNYLAGESEHLLEQTELYFRPINTIGNAKFNVGSETPVTLPLASSYDVRVHVPKVVLGDDAIKETIKTQIVKLIESYIVTATTQGNRISLTEISELIRTKLSDYITSVDAMGINGSPNLQTMTIVDTDAQPSIATKLVVNKNNQIVFEKAVNVTFVEQ